MDPSRAVDQTQFRDREPFVALLIAQVISLTGNILTMLAIPWFVLVTTGSASKAGITVAVGAAPVIIAGVFGGAVVDRLGYKRASVIADIASGVSVLLIPLLYHTIGLDFWQLLALVFLGAILDIPGRTARSSLFPDLAERAGMELDRANSINQIAYRIAGLAGPPLAGLLIAIVGASNLLWIDAATFAVSASLVTLLVPSTPVEQMETTSKGLNRYLNEVREGFQFLRHDSLLFWLTLVTAVGNLLAEPLYGIVLPVYAEEIFGSAVDLGVMFAALAAGSIAGNVLYILFVSRLPRRAILIAGFSVRALTFWVLVALPPLWLIALSIFINAVFLEPVNPLVMTIRQEHVPAGMRGRVFGATMALGAGTRPLGLLVYGFLLESISLHGTLILLASVNLAVPLAVILAPGLRDLRRPEKAEPRPAARASG